MSTSEIICLSSEDDDNEHDKSKQEKTTSGLRLKNNTTNNTRVSRKRISPLKIDVLPSKRINLISPVSKNIGDTEGDDLIEVIEIIGKKERISTTLSGSTGCDKKMENLSTSHVEHSNALNCHKTSENKPFLIIKEKHPVHITCGQDIFSMFLGQCLQRDKSADMRKIVEKLKRKYEQLDPIYAHSDEFADLLNEKRNCLLHENGPVYRYIADINEEMKLRKKGRNTVTIPQSPISSSENGGNAACAIGEDEDDENCETIYKRQRKIRAIEKTMYIVEKRIKKYEEADVDLDDDHSSNFLIMERYKRRMVDLYSKWCELTGNHDDAGRTYLRPVHLKLTGIVTVDQAINSFINSKLSMKKYTRNKTINTNYLVFPDYIDILNLIHAHNVNQKLGMDTRAEKSTAKKAFIKLGGYLKCERQKDFYDSFSSMYDQAEDPAIKNGELLNKLRENRDLGEKKLNAVFDKYSKKQEEAKLMGVDDKNSAISDDEEDDGDEEEEEEEEEVEDEEIDESDDEKLVGDSDIMCLQDSDESIHKLDSSSDAESVIIDENNEKSDNITKSCELTVIDKTICTEKIAKDVKCNDTPTTSLHAELPIVDNDNAIKPALPNDETKLDNDEKKSSSAPPTDSTEKIANNAKAIVDEVDIEPLDVQDTAILLDVKNCKKEKPMLKLRSFAKPPGFWQNSQENKDEILNSPLDSKSIEIIELDISDKQSSGNCSMVKKCVGKNSKANKPTEVVGKIASVPLASPNKDVKIFRRLVTIPVPKLTRISKVNVNLPKVSIGDRNVIIHPATTQSRCLIPLSAVELRNQKLKRPVAHIVGQRKSAATSREQEIQKITATTNLKTPHTICINPIAKGGTVLRKIPPKTQTTLNINSIPVIATNKSAKYLEFKSQPQKVINPLVKQQQQNIENMNLTKKISGYNENPSTFISS